MVFVVLSSVCCVFVDLLLLVLLFYQPFVLGLSCLCGGVMLVVQKFLPVKLLQSPYDAGTPQTSTSSP